MRVDINYLDRVQMVGYPSTPSDASIKMSELRSNDTGIYRCEVQQGIEDHHDTVHVQVQGVTPEPSTTRAYVVRGSSYHSFKLYIMVYTSYCIYCKKKTIRDTMVIIVRLLFL